MTVSHSNRKFIFWRKNMNSLTSEENCENKSQEESETNSDSLSKDSDSFQNKGRNSDFSSWHKIMSNARLSSLKLKSAISEFRSEFAKESLSPEEILKKHGANSFSPPSERSLHAALKLYAILAYRDKSDAEHDDFSYFNKSFSKTYFPNKKLDPKNLRKALAMSNDFENSQNEESETEIEENSDELSVASSAPAIKIPTSPHGIFPIIKKIEPDDSKSDDDTESF